jgi:hypothetical protein
MRDEDRIDMQEAEEMHEAMDYAQHEGTWVMFTGLVKWAIIQLAFIVVGLGCIIQFGAPIFGGLLIIVGLFLPLVWGLFAPPRRVAA